MVKLLSILLLVTSTSCTMNKADKPQRVTVAKVDLERYMGVWYEIARFPHSFEKGLVGVTATYTKLPSGKIEVLNQGYKGTLDGKRSKVKGWAKIPDPNEPGRLKVYFFWPFGGEYLVLDLDEENYSYVLVGSSSPNYLWIMSRTPQMSEETYNYLVGKAKELGYNLEKLEKVPQPEQ
jgi:lipocalin